MLKPRRYWLYLAPAALIMAVFGVGLVQVVLYSFRSDGGLFGNFADILARPDYVDLFVRTVRIAALTTGFCVLIGYPVAYVIARAQRARNLLLILVMLPWMVSIVVRTYGWIVILGNRGTLNTLLMSTGLTSSPIRLLFNEIGVVIGLVHVFSPFMVISILSTFLMVDEVFEEASMSLGAGPLETFWRVILPLTAPGLIAGCAIVFLLSSGAVVTPHLLGGPRTTMVATQIYQDVFQSFNFPKASAMALFLLLLVMVVLWPLGRLERHLGRHLRQADAQQ